MNRAHDEMNRQLLAAAQDGDLALAQQALRAAEIA